ncbi:MAG: hypothetical protein NTY20_04030 [Candidatus Aenigmarchaeota archaeon]|nr:hypothetical protein [Candidatus Aenigmarchaeota archaeon]
MTYYYGKLDREFYEALRRSTGNPISFENEKDDVYKKSFKERFEKWLWNVMTWSPIDE